VWVYTRERPVHLTHSTRKTALNSVLDEWCRTLGRPHWTRYSMNDAGHKEDRTELGTQWSLHWTRGHNKACRCGETGIKYSKLLATGTCTEPNEWSCNTVLSPENTCVRSGSESLRRNFRATHFTIYNNWFTLCFLFFFNTTVLIISLSQESLSPLFCAILNKNIIFPVL
jgi:hypothetical protein